MWRRQEERHGAAEGPTVGREGVGERPPRQAGDQGQPVAGHEGEPDRVGDVPGVDPGLGQARRGQCPGRQLARHPGDAGRQVHGRQDLEQSGCAGRPPRLERRRRKAPFVLDHARGSSVDRSGGAHAIGPGGAHGIGHLGEVLGEASRGARDRHLVGLRQVEHHVGDVPPRTARRRPPRLGVEAGEHVRQLRLLIGERRHRRVHHEGSLSGCFSGSSQPSTARTDVRVVRCPCVSCVSCLSFVSAPCRSSALDGSKSDHYARRCGTRFRDRRPS